MTVLLQMIMFFAGARALNSEWNTDGFESLFKAANGNVLSVITGKLVAYTPIGLLITLFFNGTQRIIVLDADWHYILPEFTQLLVLVTLASLAVLWRYVYLGKKNNVKV